MWDLDEAVRAAVESFVDRPGDDITWADTLLVVTSDHAQRSPEARRFAGQGRAPRPA